MKTFLSMMIAGIIVFLASTTIVTAQDFCKTDPSFNKVLVNNEFVTATEVTYEPGVRSHVHTHPGAFIYALTDGVLLVTMATGETKTFDLKAGDSTYQGPEPPHSTINPGKKPVKLLLVELKDQPYMVDKKMK